MKWIRIPAQVCRLVSDQEEIEDGWLYIPTKNETDISHIVGDENSCTLYMKNSDDYFGLDLGISDVAILIEQQC